MEKLQLIGGSPSNFVWACRILLAEKNASYDHVSVMPHTPEVDAIHPLGKIPVMRHGQVALAESRAICGYIDRVFGGPKLLPDDPAEAAQVEQWVSMVCTAIDPIWVRSYLAEYVFPSGPNGTPDRARIDSALPKMEKQFPVMEKAVAGGYLALGRFTLADAYFTPIVHYMSKAPESAALLAKSPNLTAYLERQHQRPSVRDTTPQLPPASARKAAA